MININNKTSTKIRSAMQNDDIVSNRLVSKAQFGRRT